MHRGALIGVVGGCVFASLLATSCVGDSSTGSDVGSDATAIDAIANDAGGDATSNDQFVGSDAGETDGGDAAAPLCDVGKAFAAPTMVTELEGTSFAYALRLSPDYLTGYFSMSTGGGPIMLYSSQRSSVTAPFGAAQLLSGIYSPASSGDINPSVTGDGLSLYFDTVLSTDAGGTGVHNIFLSTRPNTSATFGTPSTIQGVDDAVSGEVEPFIREDGQELYFHAPPAPALGVIYRSLKGSSGFGTPTLVSELNTSGEDSGQVTVTPDDLVVYFSSSRKDGGFKGGNDIWVASRTSTTEPFGQLANVGELNTPDYDYASFITRDRCTLYFTRRVIPLDGGVETRTIWKATKSP
jgi:hypothetical protein